MADTSLGLNFNQYAAVDAQTFEDQCLVQALREGVEDAYEVLIERYQHSVYNLVFRLLNDPADASDVVQDVFFKVFRKVGDFRGQSSLKTWIYRIAVNEAYNQRRWFSRHRQHEVGLEPDASSEFSFEDVLQAKERSPFELASDRETRSLIEECLAELPQPFRTVVVLRDIEDLSYEEIADVLQISLGTVKSRIVRGRDALRARFLARTQRQPLAHAFGPGQVELAP